MLDIPFQGYRLFTGLITDREISTGFYIPVTYYGFPVDIRGGEIIISGEGKSLTTGSTDILALIEIIPLNRITRSGACFLTIQQNTGFITLMRFDKP